MAKVIPGSAITDDDGSMLFTPYEKGKPENVTMLPLKSVDGGKLECSINKTRLTLTVPHIDINTDYSAMQKAYGKLVSALLNDKLVKKKYEMAKTMKPCEINEKLEKKPEPPIMPYDVDEKFLNGS